MHLKRFYLLSPFPSQLYCLSPQIILRRHYTSSSHMGCPKLLKSNYQCLDSRGIIVYKLATCCRYCKECNSSSVVIIELLRYLKIILSKQGGFECFRIKLIYFVESGTLVTIVCKRTVAKKNCQWLNINNEKYIPSQYVIQHGYHSFCVVPELNS